MMLYIYDLLFRFAVTRNNIWLYNRLSSLPWLPSRYTKPLIEKMDQFAIPDFPPEVLQRIDDGLAAKIQAYEAAKDKDHRSL